MFTFGGCLTALYVCEIRQIYETYFQDSRCDRPRAKFPRGSRSASRCREQSRNIPDGFTRSPCRAMFVLGTELHMATIENLTWRFSIATYRCALRLRCIDTSRNPRASGALTYNYRFTRLFMRSRAIDSTHDEAYDKKNMILSLVVLYMTSRGFLKRKVSYIQRKVL